MAKHTTSFVCQNCAGRFPKWSGRCDACQAWNTLVEQESVEHKKSASSASALKLRPVAEVAAEDTKQARIPTGLSEADAVLGGGLVAGSVVLVAGEPGMGKSTILMQVAGHIAAQSLKVGYMSGEESEQQIAMRAERLGVADEPVQLVSTTDTNAIVSTIRESKFDLVIVDSIQAVSCDDLQTASGTMSQITNSAGRLHEIAKRTNTVLILVGQVTKEGGIAGPKVLEHLVDVVLYLEGDEFGDFKLLRAHKNRYGSTNEVGIFTMTAAGLEVVKNPSAMMLQERQETDGSVIFATQQGSRTFLLEVQALVQESGGSHPRRTSIGFETNRLQLLAAVLSRRTNIDVTDADIYINIVGGFKIQEPAVDLAVCLAIASAHRGASLAPQTVVFGEVGLSGELRSVQNTEGRLREAKKLGYAKAICPKTKVRNQVISQATTLKEALTIALGE